MTAGAYEHPNDQPVRDRRRNVPLGGLPVGLPAERAGATPFRTYR